MKRIIALFALLLSVGQLAVAQEIISITKRQQDTAPEGAQVGRAQYPLYEHMQYRDYSKLYDVGNYTPRYDDPYQPWVSGVASYFIPGLGQCICGETSRGLGVFMTTELLAAGTIISFVYTPGFFSKSYYDGQTVIQQPTQWDHLRNITLLAGTCAIYVWNVFDAAKVAKIKNMYHHDIYGGPEEEEPAELAFSREVNPYMRYRDYKHLYDARSYRAQWGDPYSPVSSGVASALLPGLGQCLAGEWGRGALFFGGYVLLASSVGRDTGNYSYDSGYSIPALPLLAMAGLYIWNICDAVEVAKIKNLYARDIRGQQTSLDLNLQPYFNCVPATTGNNQLVGGLALKVNF